MQRFKLIVLGALLAASAGTGAATQTQGCFCSTIYYDDAGNTVGVRQPEACGDPGYGPTTKKYKVVAGCVM
ncbi:MULTISPECIES: DUF6289 family protein [Lysobacter]|uniref:Uncharacterized protein n=2 Tax=Lysobacter TaxID=68 RepID=A0A0S2DH53_LYSEN|nr:MULTISPECIES: DUF6289 family protein [Lysobacter]ALN57776.1 hypothetical protein GLE_2427 [Lysobacter enzymogenes]QCW26305.1 hypothetical protein FE772_12135 [Lysobacter enzymogenes]QQP99107.1 hypothetical protein JHW41_13260 [Lysobacter enzymogenes]UZW58551.1 DUF6289 family protein [Lysobacter enzymogenes]WMT02263.1 DUF6289 family protein [Lysobacter yananisis]